MNFAWPAFLKWPAAIPQPAFLWPHMLWLLALLPLLVLLYAWLLRRRRKLALRYASLSIVRQAPSRSVCRPNWVTSCCAAPMASTATSSRWWWTTNCRA